MKLSICIPTYNRAAYLEKLLKLIFDQIAAFDISTEVEILVSDNNSGDNTSSVVEKYISLGLKYNRNPENIGPDANFLKLFEAASGDYIWLPGDDDLFNDDSIKFIIDAIDTHNFDYLYLRTRATVPITRGRGVKLVTPRDLLWSTSIYTTFMTSQVIRADLVKAEVPRARQHLGGFMAYYSIFLHALANSKKCLISECQEVYPESAENTGGYKFYKVWGVAVIDVLKASPFGADHSLISKFRLDMLFFLLLPITYGIRCANGGFKFVDETPAQSLAVHYNTVGSRWLWSGYLSLPKSSLKILHALVRVVAKVRRLKYSQIA